MKYSYLSDSVNIKTIEETANSGVFEIDGLYTGYGLTIGNALRRVLLSSLPGAAITQFKIKGVGHEFSTIPSVLEDVVEIALNLKRIRLQIFTDEPQVLSLKVKGERKVTAADIETTSQVQVLTPDAHIATLTKKSAELEIELTIEKGLGYAPAESRQTGKLPVGIIAIDAIFTPVISVNYTVENMRVGDKTDYNRLHLKVITDGTIMPSRAVHKASNILKDHFEKISGMTVIEKDEEVEVKTKAKPKKAKSKEA
jgi:DNA-directed RNA polymerase subunit alpha